MPNPSLAPLEAIRRSVTFAASVLAVMVLYWLRELLIPLSVAILLAFLLRPLVVRMTRLRIPRAISAVVATGLAASLILGMLVLLSAQVVDLTAKLPDYKQNLTEKSHAIKEFVESKVGKMSGALEGVTKEFAPTTKGSSDVIQLKAAPADESWDFVSIARSIVDPVLAPLAQTGVVFILMLFLLLDFDIVTRRLNWASEHWRLGIPVDVVDEALSKVGQFLRVQLCVNIAYGCMMALALWIIGVPNALLWGAMSALLRYVPFIGPWIAASLPIALSIAVFPGWTRPAAVVISFIVAEIITNGVLEPMLYGHSTGVSSFGVVIATFFWGWLWGPVGLVLAMPITACLVVIGRHIPLLRTLSVLLSSDTIDSPATQAQVDPNKPLDVTSFLLKMR